MIVRYRALGDLKERVIPSSGEKEIPENKTVGFLLSELNLPTSDLVVMLNGKKANVTKELVNGDQVVLLSVVAGG
ncbi:MAG: MoaD/ThiS family protein [Chitinophagales bacterium]